VPSKNVVQPVADPEHIALDDVRPLIAPHLEAAVAALDENAPLLATMVRYHLGWVDASGRRATIASGKLVRPAVAMLTCQAAGGDPVTAAPLGAAIELLHNFTLIHDDIQDRSLLRRHRATVWATWGEAQAINAGDALFATAHLPLYSLSAHGVAPELVLLLADAFARMTIAIVQGQVLDLGFEGRDGIEVAAYVQMIGGKTAAIVQYAAWAGALLGGADPATAARFGEFGLSLGLGFQIRDDALGIWGSEAATGKAPADDIRRRKRSLPLLLLRERATKADAAILMLLDTNPTLDESDVTAVLRLLDRYGVRADVEACLSKFHDQSRAALTSAAEISCNPARDRLGKMLEQLAVREG